MAKKFHFNNYELSVNHNLKRWLERAGWQRALFPHEADFSDKNMALNEFILGDLEQKHRLLHLLQEANLPFMPESYVIENTIPIENLAPLPFRERVPEGRVRVNDLWFIKPALLNNGVGIQVFHDLSEVQLRYSGPHILQKGVEPHLYEGKKWSIRRLVILKGNWDYTLYPEGYANIAAFPYEREHNDKRCQITNYLLDNKMAGITQQLLSHMPLSKEHWKEMENIIQETLKALKVKYENQALSDNPNAFTLLGFDFILSNDNKLWLLEINHGMDCPKPETHPLYKSLWAGFWGEIIERYVVLSSTIDKNYCKRSNGWDIAPLPLSGEGAEGG